MKRRLFWSIGLVLGGFAGSIAIAWSCAVWSEIELLPEEIPMRVRMPRYLSPIWREEATAGHLNGSGFGVSVTSIESDSRQSPGVHLIVYRCEFGWPVRVLRYDDISVAGNPKGGAMKLIDKALQLAGLRRGVTVPESLSSRSHAMVYRRLPVWPTLGLIPSTLLYAAVLWAIPGVPRFLRSKRRQARRQCVSCGYDDRGLPAGAVCPECGDRGTPPGPGIDGGTDSSLRGPWRKSPTSDGVPSAGLRRRNRRRIVGAAVAVVAILAAAVAVVVARRDAEATAIRKVFHDYDVACSNSDTNAVIRITGDETRAWLVEMHKAALMEDASGLRARPLYDEFLVLALRDDFSRSELEQMSSDDVVRYYAAQLAKGPPFRNDWEILQLQVHGDRATASVGWREGPKEIYAAHDVTFSRTADGWRLNQHTLFYGIYGGMGPAWIPQSQIDRIIQETWTDVHHHAFDASL